MIGTVVASVSDTFGGYRNIYFTSKAQPTMEATQSTKTPLVDAVSLSPAARRLIEQSERITKLNNNV